MLTLITPAQLRAATLNARLHPHLRALLRLRFEQLGGDGADFHVMSRTDTLADAEEAVGWPLAADGSPQWEWALGHPGGWTEVTFVLSDDGPAQVLLVPPDPHPAVADLLRSFA